MYNINLNALKYFVQVAATKNITKASENLNISQPALTKALHILEDELNTTLFIRSKKGVTLTEEGTILYEYAKNMFSTLNNTINIINDKKNNEAHLYIGATTTNFLEPIIDVLREFRKMYPNVKIEMVLEDIAVLEKYDKLGKLDILIKNDYEFIEGFYTIKSFSIEDKFIASKDTFGNLVNVSFKLEDLLEYPFVLLSNITHGRKNFDAYLRSKNIVFKPTYEFNSYSLCRELIKTGFGIGIGNPIHYKSKDFIILNTNFHLPVRSFNICSKKEPNKIVEDFIKLLQK